MKEMAVLAFGELLKATIAGSILAVVVAALQFSAKRRLTPAWRYALWLPVLLRLIIPVFPESSWSLFNLPRWVELGPRAEPRVTVELMDRAQ
ncbi:MAG TPA: M56 family metallopeptidase, partial [Verrucomicrobiae bacterium]|nr:M56 family metallopeptidase [Verrucomicrobiae bacterium]